jgi:hypothetical protein
MYDTGYGTRDTGLDIGHWKLDMGNRMTSRKP